MAKQQAPPIQWLVVFEAAASSLSFKQAANQLNVSPSAVSQTLKNLEAWLEVSLFERHTRSISLTEAGEFYLEVASKLVLEHKRGYSEFLRRYRNRSLHVSAPLFIAQDLMIPNYLSFADYLPNAELRIEARTSYVDFDVEPLDAAIRFGDGGWPGLDCRQLCPIYLAPVCSAQYALDNPIDDFTSLAEHRLISPMADLTLWRRLLGDEVGAKGDFLVCDSYLAAVTAASQGLGVALALLPTTNNWINDGRLVLPLQMQIATAFAYWMVTPQGKRRQQEVEAFYQWSQSLFEKLLPLEQPLQTVALPLEERSF